jgi:hypothetical protein
LDTTSILTVVLDDGLYTIDRINNRVLEAQPYAFRVSSNGRYIALYQYANLNDKALDVNRTEIVGHQNESVLNAEIYSNRIDPNVIRLYCNAFPVWSNDHGQSSVHIDNYIEIPVAVSEM